MHDHWFGCIRMHRILHQLQWALNQTSKENVLWKMGLLEDQKTGMFRAYSSSILQQEILMEVKMISECCTRRQKEHSHPAMREAVRNGELTPLCWQGVSAPVSTALWRAASSGSVHAKSTSYLIYFNRCNELTRNKKPAELIYTAEWKDSIPLWNQSAQIQFYSTENGKQFYLVCETHSKMQRCDHFQ